MMAEGPRGERQQMAETYAAYARDGSTGRWSPEQPGNAAVLRERDQWVEHLLARRPARRTLEIGCGRGEVLAALPVAADVRVGIDLLDDRLRAADRDGGSFSVIHGDGAHLPVADASVDLVVAFTVFSSVLDASTRTRIADEISRVVRKGGALLWYDLRYSNPFNRQIEPVTADDLAALFPEWDIDLATTTVVPPLARRLGRATARLYPLLAGVPVLRTHQIGLLTR